MKDKDNIIKDIMKILHDVNKDRGEDYFNGVVDVLLDSKPEVISNYLIVLKKLL